MAGTVRGPSPPSQHHQSQMFTMDLVLSGDARESASCRLQAAPQPTLLWVLSGSVPGPASLHLLFEA